MAVLAVVLVSVTTFLASANKPIRSIAVLPFVNLSSDAEQEYFTDGMTDELITDLAKTSGLLVISHTSVERYKNTTLPLPSIARELGVDAVVEGRVLRSEGRVRISAQLIDTRTDRHIWADSYERELGDVLSLQDELARRIAAEVGVKMTRRLETAARPVNPAAHDAYMKGNFYWNRLTCDGFKRGREYFQQSVNRDPNFALAYVGLAQSYFTLWDWGCAPTADVIAQSKAAVVRAIDLDPGMGEAHAWLGKILFFSERDWEHAEQQLTQAIALNPNYAHAHTMYAVLLVARGRQEQGFAEMRRSLELDPTSELTNVVSTFAFYLAHQYDRAIEQGKKTAELYPNSSALYFWLAAAYERKGLYDQAVSAYLKEKAFAGVPASEVAAFRGAYDSGGIRGYWRRELDAAKANTTGNACWTAMIYGHLGDEQGALEALNRGLQQHCSGLHLLNVDPLYDGFRSDPGFQALMRRARM
jgi:TolB-like protein